MAQCEVKTTKTQFQLCECKPAKHAHHHDKLSPAEPWLGALTTSLPWLPLTCAAHTGAARTSSPGLYHLQACMHALRHEALHLVVLSHHDPDGHPEQAQRHKR